MNNEGTSLVSYLSSLPAPLTQNFFKTIRQLFGSCSLLVHYTFYHWTIELNHPGVTRRLWYKVPYKNVVLTTYFFDYQTLIKPDGALVARRQRAVGTVGEGHRRGARREWGERAPLSGTPLPKKNKKTPTPSNIAQLRRRRSKYKLDHYLMLQFPT